MQKITDAAKFTVKSYNVEDENTFLENSSDKEPKLLRIMLNNMWKLKGPTVGEQKTHDNFAL